MKGPGVYLSGRRVFLLLSAFDCRSVRWLSIVDILVVLKGYKLWYRVSPIAPPVQNECGK